MANLSAKRTFSSYVVDLPHLRPGAAYLKRYPSYPVRWRVRQIPKIRDKRLEMSQTTMEEGQSEVLRVLTPGGGGAKDFYILGVL